MMHIESHNIEEAWKQGFWTGAGLVFALIAAGLILAAMFVYSAPLEAQDYEGPTEPVSPRQQMMDWATTAALETVSDTELRHCLPDAPAAVLMRCDADKPGWQRLDGLPVVRLP